MSEERSRDELVARLLELERLPPTAERRAEWRALHRVIWPRAGDSQETGEGDDVEP